MLDFVLFVNPDSMHLFLQAQELKIEIYQQIDLGLSELSDFKLIQLKPLYLNLFFLLNFLKITKVQWVNKRFRGVYKNLLCEENLTILKLF